MQGRGWVSGLLNSLGAFVLGLAACGDPNDPSDPSDPAGTPGATDFEGPDDTDDPDDPPPVTDPKPPQGPPPNVLLITSDDLGPYLSTYGETRIHTPNLDALAAEGVRFDRAYVTQASCSPSRATLFTGLYPHTNGQIGLVSSGFEMVPEMVSRTIPALLQDAGYQTGVIGKVHVGPAEGFPFDYAHKTVAETRDVQLVANRAREFIDGAEDEPFFLMVNYSDPHAFPAEGGGWYFPPQAHGLPQNPISPGPETLLAFQGVDSDAHRERVANYLNAVRRVDDGVGMVLDVLEDSGRAQETLVIFVGDHGAPFDRGKTTTYEAGLRVPLLIRWPQHRTPVVTTVLTSTADIAPTIFEAARVELPTPMHGHSLWPMSWGEAPPEREFLVAEFHYHGIVPFFPRRSIRDRDGNKLIYNLVAGRSKPPKRIDGDLAFPLSQEPQYDGTWEREALDRYADPPQWEYYDLAQDPHEIINLADSEAHLEIQAELRQALEAWQVETDDPFRDPAYVDEILDTGSPP